jgi:hypothetical protein
MGLLAQSLLDIAEDRSLCPCLIPLQTDVICAAWDNKLINLSERHEPILKGVVCQCKSHYKEYWAADNILALRESKLLAAQT